MQIAVGGTLFLMSCTLWASYTVAKIRTQSPWSETRDLAESAIHEWIRATGRVPALVELPDEVQEALRRDESVHYSKDRGLTFEFDRVVPFQVTWSGALSFGLLETSEGTDSLYESPETLLSRANRPISAK